jgi:hypothetical protein
MFSTVTTESVKFVGRVFSQNPGRTYPEGTPVTVFGKVVHDGVCLTKFPGGEETYVSISRLESTPGRSS